MSIIQKFWMILKKRLNIFIIFLIYIFEMNRNM